MKIPQTNIVKVQKVNNHRVHIPVKCSVYTQPKVDTFEKTVNTPAQAETQIPEASYLDEPDNMINDQSVDCIELENFFINDKTNLKSYQVVNSQINDIKGFNDCSLDLQNSNIGNLEVFDTIDVKGNNIIDQINNSNIVEITGAEPSKIQSVVSNCVTVDNESKISSILSPSVVINSAADIGELSASKLVIKVKGDGLAHIGEARVLDMPKEYRLTIPKISRSELHDNYTSLPTGSADIEKCNIYALACKNVKAKDASIYELIVLNDVNLENCDIRYLTAQKVDNIKSSVISNLQTDSRELTLCLDKTSQVNNVKFLGNPGTLIIKNNGNYVPDINVENGKIKYELEDIDIDSIIIRGDLVAKGNSKIGSIFSTKSNSEIQLIGNCEVDDIDFNVYSDDSASKGTVIIKPDRNGLIADPSKIHINNGKIVTNRDMPGFEQVAGMSELKDQLREDIINPMKNPEEYEKYGIDAINGFLMYGPPGCGKTFITQKLAEETDRYFVEITPSNVGSKYIHETTTNVNKKFEEAREHAPSIIFIDEAESLMPSRNELSADRIDRSEVVTEFLQQLNNAKDNGIVVVLASNEPQKIDEAIKRTGRIDKKIFVPNPDTETRKQLFEQKLKDSYIDSSIDFQELAEKTEYYTAEDIRMVIRKAALTAMKNKLPITQNDIISALKEVAPSLSKQKIEEYRLKGDTETKKPNVIGFVS